MPIKPDPRIQARIEKELKRMAEKMYRRMVRQLRYIGETAVRTARSLPSPSAADFPTYPKIPPHQPNYIDRTANLRSSIGYVVVVNGKIAEEGGFEGEEDGMEAGRSLAHKLAQHYPEKGVLIVVAGESYATYVSAKGYDVLDSAHLIASRLVSKLRR